MKVRFLHRSLFPSYSKHELILSELYRRLQESELRAAAAIMAVQQLEQTQQMLLDRIEVQLSTIADLETANEGKAPMPIPENNTVVCLSFLLPHFLHFELLLL
jgi:hypothetical protein